jgi:hypothetical protein
MALDIIFLFVLSCTVVLLYGNTVLNLKAVSPSDISECVVFFENS